MWYFQDYTYSSTGLNLISEVKEDRGTYYYYKGTAKRTWKYNHYHVNYDKVTDEETGEVDYILRSLTKNAVTYRETSTYTHTEYISAAQQAADNKEVIKNLGDPPPNMEPTWTVTTVNGEVENGSEVLLDFTSTKPDEKEKVKTAILQAELNKVLNTDLKIDGWYGNNTKSAVEELQKSFGIDPSGKFDKQTLYQLEMATSNFVDDDTFGNDYDINESVGSINIEVTDNYVAYNPLTKSINSFKEIGNGFIEGLEDRANHALDSPYDSANYLTVGLLDAIWSGAQERSSNMTNSTYDFFNWLTIGSLDTINGALNPEDPLSPEHWLNSFGATTIFYGGSKVPKGKVGSGVTSGATKTVQTTRVGQWMSEAEYEQFVKTGEIPRTNVLTKGKEGFIKQANADDYYAEFDIDSSLLVPKNDELGWSLVKSKNDMHLKLTEKRGQSLPAPIGENITHITTK